MRNPGFALFLAVAVSTAPIVSSAQSQTTNSPAASAFGAVVMAMNQKPVSQARLEFVSVKTRNTAATLTKADGTFDLAGLAPGQYRLSVSAPKCDPYAADVSVEGRTGPFFLELTEAARAATPVNNAVVSLRELKMSGKGQSELRKGTDLLLKGKTRGSLKYFERAVAKDPGSYRAYHNLGIAEYQLGEKDRAKDDFERAIELTSGGFAPSEFALSIILFENHKFRQAEELLQRGLVMEPGSAIGKYYLGLVQFAFNELPDAEQSAHEALLCDSDQARAHILLAMIHNRNHNPYAVEADAEAYLQHDPRGPLNSEANFLLRRAQEEITQIAEAGL